MLDLKTIWEILATVGLSGLVVIIIAYAIQIILRVWANRANAQTRQFNASTQQEEIVNSFAVKFNDDIRQMREQHNLETRELRNRFDELQEKFHATDKELAREQGRREQMQETMELDRQERNQLKDEVQRQNTRIIELEKYQQQSVLRIKELESEIEALNKKLASANVEVDLLQAQKQELEAQLGRERNRADSLSKLIERLQQPSISNDTQALPELSVDDTVTPIPTPSAAIVAAEEIKP